MPNRQGVPTTSDLISQASDLGDFLQKPRLMDKQSQIKLNEDSAKRTAEMDQLKQLFGGTNPQESLQNATARGQSIKLGDVAIGQDPYSKLIGAQQKGTDSAIRNAVHIYQQGLPDIQKSTAASVEGLQAINDPKQVGSLGQARSLMLRAMGMNRYNENEASASLPGNLFSVAKKLFDQTAGSDLNPLSDSQRAAAASFFNGHLKNAKNKHEVLKQNALNAYQVSPYYDANRADQLKSTIGAPFDNYLSSNSPKEDPSQMQPQSQQPQQQPGVLDKLKSFFTGSQQPQQTPMSFEEFKAKKKAGQL